MTTRSVKAAEAKVKKKYPLAFGWREFTVSDYTVHSGTGLLLATAYHAKDAWISAAAHLAKDRAP